MWIRLGWAFINVLWVKGYVYSSTVIIYIMEERQYCIGIISLVAIECSGNFCNNGNNKDSVGLLHW